MNFRLSLYFLRIEILRTFASKENGPIISRIRSSDPREISKATTLSLSLKLPLRERNVRACA